MYDYIGIETLAYSHDLQNFLLALVLEQTLLRPSHWSQLVAVSQLSASSEKQSLRQDFACGRLHWIVELCDYANPTYFWAFQRLAHFTGGWDDSGANDWLFRSLWRSWCLWFLWSTCWLSWISWSLAPISLGLIAEFLTSCHALFLSSYNADEC